MSVSRTTTSSPTGELFDCSRGVLRSEHWLWWTAGMIGLRCTRQAGYYLSMPVQPALNILSSMIAYRHLHYMLRFCRNSGGEFEHTVCDIVNSLEIFFTLSKHIQTGLVSGRIIMCMCMCMCIHEQFWSRFWSVSDDIVRGEESGRCKTNKLFLFVYDM